MPKVSICIPTFNNLEAFKRCFQSILIQTFQDYEVIITDDSSNNDIECYLKKYNDLKNIFYYKNKSPLGSPENWNEAMRRSKGEFLKILHHDDFFTYNSSLETFVKLLDENPESDFAFVASKNFNLLKNEIINYNRPRQEIIENIKKNPTILLNGNFIGAPSAIIIRNNNNLFFDKKTIWLVDLDFYIRSLQRNPMIRYSENDAISIGISSSQLTKTLEDDKNTNIFEYFYLLEKYKIFKIINSPYQKQITSILKKFSINNVNQIRNAGFNGKIPKDLRMFFFSKSFNNFKSFLKRWF